MSKFLSLLKKGNDNSGSNDAIRRTATETMAHLLERNSKFELFLEEKLTELERRSGAGRAPLEAPSSADDGYFDYYEAAPEPEEVPSEDEIAAEASEPLVPARSFGVPMGRAPEMEAADSWTDDDPLPVAPVAPASDETVADTPVTPEAEEPPMWADDDFFTEEAEEEIEVPAPAEPEAAPDWQAMFGLDEGDGSTPADWSEESLSDDDGEMGDFD